MAKLKADSPLAQAARADLSKESGLTYYRALKRRLAGKPGAQAFLAHEAKRLGLAPPEPLSPSPPNSTGEGRRGNR